MIELQLKHGLVALIDDEDLEKVNALSRDWRMVNNYPACTAYRNGEPRAFYLHNLILPPKEGFQVDHINGIKIDNRKANLRHVTISQNHMNCETYTNNTSGYKGVRFRKDRGKFDARIVCPDGKRISLGHFNTAREAAEAYNHAAKNLHGEHAKLNQL